MPPEKIQATASVLSKRHPDVWPDWSWKASRPVSDAVIVDHLQVPALLGTQAFSTAFNPETK